MAESATRLGGRLMSDMSATSERLNVNIFPSPTSGNSSDTLHDNESSDDDRKRSNFSPLSVATLNFEDLSIRDEGSQDPQKDANLFASPTHSTAEHQFRLAPVYSHPVQHFRRSNCHSGSGNGPQGRGGHRNVRNWVPEEARAAQEFLVIRNSMKRLFKNADVAKWKVADYIAHREAMMASAARKLAQQTQDREDSAPLCIPPISPQQQDMMRRYGLNGNFDQIGNYGRILGEKTVWCKDWQNGKEEIAPWPCLAELKWEGDDRAKTGVGRYPPLPREQGPLGLPWNQLQAVEQYPMDQIARIPTMEDIYLPVDEIDDEVKYDLLNKDLEDAMEAYLES